MRMPSWHALTASNSPHPEQLEAASATCTCSNRAVRPRSRSGFLAHLPRILTSELLGAARERGLVPVLAHAVADGWMAITRRRVAVWARVGWVLVRWRDRRSSRGGREIPGALWPG
jgi:hypothetical protein